MTIWADEISVAASQPIELIDMVCGLVHWRQCSGPVSTDYGGYTYTAIEGLTLGEIEDDTSFLRQCLEITTDWSNPFVRQYPGTPPEGLVTITVYRLQGDESSTWWSGYVAAVRRQADRSATIKCTASRAELGTGAMCLRVSRQCQVPVYSELCAVTQSAYEVVGVVDSVDGDTITSSTFADYEDDYFTGGPIDLGGYQRMIVSHTGITAILSTPVPGLAVLMPWTAAPGCDHTIATCVTRFANWANYRGFTNLAEQSPFRTGVL